MSIQTKLKMLKNKNQELFVVKKESILFEVKYNKLKCDTQNFNIIVNEMYIKMLDEWNYPVTKNVENYLKYLAFYNVSEYIQYLLKFFRNNNCKNVISLFDNLTAEFDYLTKQEIQEFKQIENPSLEKFKYKLNRVFEYGYGKYLFFAKAPEYSRKTLCFENERIKYFENLVKIEMSSVNKVPEFFLETQIKQIEVKKTEEKLRLEKDNIREKKQERLELVREERSKEYRRQEQLKYLQYVESGQKEIDEEYDLIWEERRENNARESSNGWQ